MKDRIKKELNILTENKVISQEEINDNLSRLKKERKDAMRKRSAINKQIKDFDKLIEYWANMLPNQTSLF